MLVVRLTAILALVYSLSLNPATDAGFGIDPNGKSVAASGDHRCTITRMGTAPRRLATEEALMTQTVRPVRPVAAVKGALTAPMLWARSGIAPYPQHACITG
jgi:hypothetical protein